MRPSRSICFFRAWRRRDVVLRLKTLGSRSKPKRARLSEREAIGFVGELIPYRQSAHARVAASQLARVSEQPASLSFSLETRAYLSSGLGGPGKGGSLPGYRRLQNDEGENHEKNQATFHRCWIGRFDERPLHKRQLFRDGLRLLRSQLQRDAAGRRQHPMHEHGPHRNLYCL